MGEIVSTSTDQEMWDFLDRNDFIKWEGEYWVLTSKLDKETNTCDCMACQARRAMKILKLEDVDEHRDEKEKWEKPCRFGGTCTDEKLYANCVDDDRMKNNWMCWRDGILRREAEG